MGFEQREREGKARGGFENRDWGGYTYNLKEMERG